ncbi:hypothetical protein Tco_1041479 [Tanacetum coccineum]|uniref:Uncharacterized protein n=1 Tax=Tanacetum coccineum TaxID=301880 RepID=A0ABQ5GGV7_9ASTR
MANSFTVSGLVVAEPGVGATTRSAAHMGSSSIGLSFVPSFEWDSPVSLMKSMIQGSFRLLKFLLLVEEATAGED